MIKRNIGLETRLIDERPDLSRTISGKVEWTTESANRAGHRDERLRHG